ncbi:MAG: Xaa-Pro peptidase family protein [Candidatus Omnitrophica bacterium]|nr:Xaa-Pro peptidase family protein [Candidatus Omnitrophota bacterium]
MAIGSLPRLRDKMAEYGVEGLVIGGGDNVSYLLNYKNQDASLCHRNLLENGSALIIPREGTPVLVTQIPGLVMDATSRMPYLEVRKAERSYPEIVQEVILVIRQKGLTREHLGIDMDFVPGSWMEQLRKEMPRTVWFDARRLLEEVRLVKTEQEIEFIRKSIRALEAGFKAVRRELKPRRKTEEMHSVFCQAVLSAGGFPELCSAGALARQWGVPPYPMWFGYSERVQADAPFRLDACASFQFYFSDMMRTFFCGEISKEAREAYQACSDFKNFMVGSIRLGMKVKELYEQVKERARTLGNSGYFGFHSIGLTIHEGPFFSKREPSAAHTDMVFVPNMVFCVEKSWSCHDGSWVMGEEDMYLLRKTGVERLTSLPEVLLSCSSSG